jgi:hypothetical protein
MVKKILEDEKNDIIYLAKRKPKESAAHCTFSASGSSI